MADSLMDRLMEVMDSQSLLLHMMHQHILQVMNLDILFPVDMQRGSCQNRQWQCQPEDIVFDWMCMTFLRLLNSLTDMFHQDNVQMLGDMLCELDIERRRHCIHHLDNELMVNYM